MEAPTIELKDITFEAEEKCIVRNVSIAFEEGITTALVGPSGGGKSTVLKIAAGLIVPTEGEVLYRGRDVNEMSRAENLAFRKDAAFVFQDSALWANQTIRQTLELPLQMHYPKMTHAQRADRIAKVLDEVGYRKGTNIRPSQLSMGEQKLIAFARALILEPSVLFLDEWTESLDDFAAKRLVSIVKTMQQVGTTIVFISHNFKVVKELAARVCMIRDGEFAFGVDAREIATNESLSKMIEQGIAV